MEVQAQDMRGGAALFPKAKTSTADSLDHLAASWVWLAICSGHKGCMGLSTLSQSIQVLPMNVTG